MMELFTISPFLHPWIQTFSPTEPAVVEYCSLIYMPVKKKMVYLRIR